MAFARGGLRRLGRAAAPAGPGLVQLFAALPVAVLVIDDQSQIVQVNAACEALLNQSESSLTGQPLKAVMTTPEGYDDRVEGRGFAAYDTGVTTARGQQIHVDFIESLLLDYPGWRIVTLQGGAASRRMGRSAERAGGARAAIGAAAMLAHEIKNPLSGIRGAAQLLGADGDPELTELITTEVDRIAALIDRMQDFTDTRPLAIEATNIYPLLGHARRVALAGFARDIDIAERFDPSLPPALVDRDALLQIILNLLKNAAEAKPSNILLTTAYRHGMSFGARAGAPRRSLPIELCVIDTGPGAPTDIADHLFDPFVSSKPEGQGLGLALVDKLVRDMGGIVQYSREGQPARTVFRVLLPCQRE